MGVDIDITKLKLNNGRTIVQQLCHEADRFMNILQEEIDIWYRSYTPVEYERSWRMRDSICVDNYVSVSIDATRLSIRVKFNKNAFHKSLWGNEEVNILLLMNSGYETKSGWHKNIEYFGYRSAGMFLERAIKRFNNTNNFGITVEAEY